MNPGTPTISQNTLDAYYVFVFKNGLDFVKVVTFNYFLKFGFVKTPRYILTPQIYDFIVGWVASECLSSLKLLPESNLDYGLW